MNDLAATVLDIASNAVRANASIVQISIHESKQYDFFRLLIQDNGKGMDEETINQALNPFYSTRTTRSIGMGLPLLNDLAKGCNGSLNIDSKVGVFTKVLLEIQRSHIDVPPMGDIGEAIMILIQSNDRIHYIFNYQSDEETYQLDTNEVKQVLETDSLNDYMILNWIKENVNQQF